MNNYSKLNNILGWIVFAIASFVYISTAEPTASFWDCGEYIATAYKLQVGHPPGAPLFQLIGRFFSLFAFGDTSHVALMVNIMSGLSSSFTILFLFWTLTMLGRKLAAKSGEMSEGKMLAIFGSAAVGSLAYTFSDSFWFSAVEGEVYAMSSFFTALVFWAILKWDQHADEPHSFRWLIFIFYLIGLSIGVHLLNLLAIPAITFVYYLRKYKASPKGLIITFGISILLLAFIMNGIIPLIAKLAGMFELFFVNTIGLPFNSGTIIYFLLLIGGIVFGIRYTRQKQKVVWNTVIWAFTVILIGYSSFLMLVIRSNANTPIDENNPEDAISLLAYLNREQYGTWPIFYGNYFNAPIVEREDGSPVYRKSREEGKYIVINDKKATVPVYDPDFSTIFPRMWNNQEQRYIDDYKVWSKLKGIPTVVDNEMGEPTTLYKPTFGENLRYFFRYQLNHMYFRYFMWNFSGRQNDLQGFANRKDGNWITGIKFIDEARLGGPVLDVPKSLQNKAENKFYMLPLILGLIGLVYQIRKDRNNFYVVLLLFIMTGLAIVVYLNQHSPQPRERDYAYAASFYAFSIWIGLGVYALWDMLHKKLDPKIAAYAVSAASLLLVPGIMAKEGWDDHNRSGRYTAVAMASNYLNSCAPNAILFTNGDNDTFPLWYAQEVEGIRTDVRVVNLSLLNTEWYIDQMKRKAYDSDPVPFTLPEDQYKDGTRNYTYFIENDKIKGYVELRELMNFLKTEPDKLVRDTHFGPIEFFPTKKIKITVDSAQIIKTGTLSPERANLMVDAIEWKLPGTGITKNHLMVLDLLASNNWERPVYFAITTGKSSYVGLEDYFQIEGLTYRLVPIKTPEVGITIGATATDIMFDNLINKYEFGGMNKPGVYLDETNVRMAMNMRNNFSRLAEALADEGKADSALQVIEYCMQMVPPEQVPLNYYSISFGEACFKIGADKEGTEIYEQLIENLSEQLDYFFMFTGERAKSWDQDKNQNMAMLNQVIRICDRYKQQELAEKANTIFEKYYANFMR
ncbi:MAG: DUF2723 domain-containing protein [Bacteroidales bacterium]